MESFEKSVKFQTDTIETITRTLPGLAPEVLARDNAQAIVAHLFSRMRTNDVGALVKNLEKIKLLDVGCGDGTFLKFIKIKY